jgi:Cu(I)/Ag(I) efflux system membrane fusion protein
VRRLAWSLLVLAAVLAAGIGGYRLGRDDLTKPVAITAGDAAEAAPQAPNGPVIYYQDPDGKPIYAGEPTTTPDGRPYRAVHASEDVSFDDEGRTVEPGAPGPRADRRILYYRNPMGLPDVSKTPKKDSMGMDYVPVYEGEDEDGSTVKLTPGKLQRIGVKTEPVARRVIAQPVRAPGSLQLDERRVSVIALRTEAYVEKVEDVTTGSKVHKDQPLIQVYSPTISSVAAEYVQTLGMRADVSYRGTRRRLLNLGAPEQLVAMIERTHEVPLAFTLAAPRHGLVLARYVVEGQRVTPGEVMFRIADHSQLWATVDVAERDLAAVAENQPVVVRVRSYPDRSFPGKVALVYPHLDPATRTVHVRIELDNRDGLLKPDMYADAEIDTGGGEAVLAVPDSAVIDSGDRQVVIVDKGGGRFEPRAVQLGRRGAGYVEIRNGVMEDEAVVTTANFLIDAESNLKSALKSLSGAGAAP